VVGIGDAQRVGRAADVVALSTDRSPSYDRSARSLWSRRCRWTRGRRAAVGAAEWRGAAYTLVGLAAILVAASGSAPGDVLGAPETLAVGAATAAVIGLPVGPNTRPGLRHATTSGFASGLASALTRTVTVAATDRSGPLLSVRVVGVALWLAAFAAGGLLLS
jgi:hypothetical protein